MRRVRPGEPCRVCMSDHCHANPPHFVQESSVRRVAEELVESDPDRAFGLATAGVRYTQKELKDVVVLAQKTLQDLLRGLSELDLADLYKGEDAALRTVYAADGTFRKIAPKLIGLVDEFEKDTQKFTAVARERARQGAEG